MWRREEGQGKRQGHGRINTRGWRKRKDRTHNEGLVEVGAKQTLLPIVAHGASHGLGDSLVDAEGDPGLVVEELLVGVNEFSARRREADAPDGPRSGCGQGRGRRRDGDWGDLGLLVVTGSLGTPGWVVLVLVRLGVGVVVVDDNRGRLDGCRRGSQRDGRRGQGR